MSTLWCWTSGATVNLYDKASQNFIKSVMWGSIDFWAKQDWWESKTTKFTEVNTSVYKIVASYLRDFLKKKKKQPNIQKETLITISFPKGKKFYHKVKMNSTYCFFSCALFDHVLLSLINIIVREITYSTWIHCTVFPIT